MTAHGNISTQDTKGVAEKIQMRDSKTGRFVKESNTYITDMDGIIHVLKGDKYLFFTDDERVLDHVWCPMANGYSATHIDTKPIMAHRLLMNPAQGELVDHINHNKQDNRLCNLRIANKSQNAYNSKTRSTNTSGTMGVYFRKDTQKWVACIRNNYKKIALGCYEKKEDAIKARKEAEKIYMKEFAYDQSE